jgi:uncharacterized peroxidase-related enzyme
MMSFLRTVAEDEASGEVAENYAADNAHYGYLPNYSRLFSLHPLAYRAWGGLIQSIRKGMDRRRYELATIGAARELRSTYCSLAHGTILDEDYFDTGDVVRIVEGDGAAVLSEVDSGIVAFAAKVAADATTVTQEDIDRLRALGLSDGEIFEVVLSAAARSFFTKVLDATGTLADSLYNDLDPELREALTAARPIASR